MSTRSCIARPVADEWAGRYHHSDGYPTGLGAELWKLVQANGVEWARHTLIDEHTGWSSILCSDWSKAPGFGGEGPRCFCHGERNEEGWLIRSRDQKHNEALHIEWVYVLGNMGLAVYMSQRVPGKTRRETVNGRTLTSPRYDWQYVETFAWNGAEPNWQAIETGRYAEAS